MATVVRTRTGDSEYAQSPRLRNSAGFTVRFTLTQPHPQEKELPIQCGGNTGTAPAERGDQAGTRTGDHSHMSGARARERERGRERLSARGCWHKSGRSDWQATPLK